MADAIQTLIQDLQSHTYSARDQVVICLIANFINALNEIEGGISPVVLPENPNTVYAGPVVGPPAVPTFRTLTAADIPSDALTGRNKLINGDFRIDQRNNFTSQPVGGGSFIADRWQFGNSQTGIWTSIVATSVTAGVSNTIAQANLVTNHLPAGSDNFLISQSIEANNITDLRFGGIDANDITLSFKVFSTKPGLFAVAIRNGVANRSYVATYNIPLANTFTPIVITIPGDIAGTWQLNGTNYGMIVSFDLGCGPGLQSPSPNAWVPGNFVTVAGVIQACNSFPESFMLQNVQLEIAPVNATPANPLATEFEYRQYGTELLLCQRWYQTYTYQTSQLFAAGQCFSLSALSVPFPFQVPMRTAPTASLPAVGAGADQMYPTPAAGGTPSAFGTLVAGRIDPTMCRIDGAGFTGSFAVGQSTLLSAGSTSTTLSFSAE